MNDKINPWEFIYCKTETINSEEILKSTIINRSSDQNFCKIPGTFNAATDLVQCTLCDSIILTSRITHHHELHHRFVNINEIVEETKPIYIEKYDHRNISTQYNPKHSLSSTCINESHKKTRLSNQNSVDPTMLHECFSSLCKNWGYENENPRTGETFGTSETELNTPYPSSLPPIDLPDGERPQTGIDTNSGYDNMFFDFCDIFPDNPDLYRKCDLELTEAQMIMKESSVHVNTLISPSQENMSDNAFLSADMFSNTGKHSENSDGQSHTLETPSPDFFTLPSASSSSTYSVDSNIFTTSELSTLDSSFNFPGYRVNDDIKSPPTSMPVLVRFTHARSNPENDVELDQAVASIVDDVVDLDGCETASTVKENPIKDVFLKTNVKMFSPCCPISDDGFPLLSPINISNAGESQTQTMNMGEQPFDSSAWNEQQQSSIASNDNNDATESAVPCSDNGELNWEIWDSLELPGCDYSDSEGVESLSMLKPTDFLSTLDPYLPTGEIDQIENATVLPEPQSIEVQIPQMTQFFQPPIAIEPAKFQLSVDSKLTKSDSNSRSRRTTDNLTGSLPLHLWPFDPRLHCGVQRDGTVCRRSLLCKLHSMGLKRQVSRPEDIGLLVKQLREAKRLKKLSFSKHESGDCLSGRRTGSSTFILPNTCVSTATTLVDPSRGKLEQYKLADGTLSGLKCISSQLLKPTLELAPCAVANQQPIGTTTLLRCGYGNSIQMSNAANLLAQSGLQLVESANRFGEKQLQIQATSCYQNTTGGITVVSDAMQGTSSINCEPTLLTNRSQSSSYLQLTSNPQSQTVPSSQVSSYPQNRQLCSVIGVAQKQSQFDNNSSNNNNNTTHQNHIPSSQTGTYVSMGGLPVSVKMLSPHQHHQNHHQQSPSVVVSQASLQQQQHRLIDSRDYSSGNGQTMSNNSATIIVGHSDNSGGDRNQCNGGGMPILQYSNDKVDSINMLSPNSTTNCISLPPRSARVVQLILPQSAAALSFRPHPTSGSTSVIQLSTGSSAMVGGATIPLSQFKQAEDMQHQVRSYTDTITAEVGNRDTCSVGEIHMNMTHTPLLENETIELQASNQNEISIIGQKALPASSSLLTLAEWEQLHKAGSIVLPTSRGMSFDPTSVSIDSFPDKNQETCVTSSDDRQQQAAAAEAMSSWLDFPSNGFLEASPSVPSISEDSEQQLASRTSISEKATGGNHSKLRILLFDMEEEGEGGSVGGSEKGEGKDSSGVDDVESGVQKLVRKRGLTDDSGMVYSSTVNSSLPTAIVAPTAFSNSLASPASDECVPNKSVDDVSRIVNGIVTKNKSVLQQPIKRRRQTSSVQQEGSLSVAVCSDLRINSPSPSKQKKTDDQFDNSMEGLAQRGALLSGTTLFLSNGNTPEGTATGSIGGGGGILNLQPNRISVPGQSPITVSSGFGGTALPLPQYPSVSGGGNIIMCPGGAGGFSQISSVSPSNTQVTSTCQTGMPISTNWNCQMKNSRAPLTLLRLANGQLAALPSIISNGNQHQQLLQTTLLQQSQPIQSLVQQQQQQQQQGTTLVLRYQQHQQKTGSLEYATATGGNQTLQFDQMVNANRNCIATSGGSLAIVNGHYQFTQQQQFQIPDNQQQSNHHQVIMVSGKSACYTGLDLNNNGMAGLRAESDGATGRGGMISLPGDHRALHEADQIIQQASSAGFQQSQQQQQQQPMAVLVRGANSQNTVQLLIPQPDGTMVLQPATQNSTCLQQRIATSNQVGSISLMPQQQQPSTGTTTNISDAQQQQQQQQQQNFNFHSDDNGAIFHQQQQANASGSTTTGLCLSQNGMVTLQTGSAAAQYISNVTPSVDDSSAGAVTGNAGGFIELVATGVEGGQRSLVSAGDLSKWLRGSSKTLDGSAALASSQHMFPTSQQSCMDTNSLIKIPSNQIRAGSQPQQQLVFLTSNGTASVLPANMSGAFNNVVVQQNASDSSRTLWTPAPQN